MSDKNKLSRRNVIKLGMTGTVMSMISVTEGRRYSAFKATPREVEGPFYPVVDQRDKDADLTRITGQSGSAKGLHIIIAGSVMDTVGQPIENAIIDIWQANAAGRYNHPRDPNPAPRDTDFQGWAIVRSGKDGLYRFKTVKPGAYPATSTWIRPPHIHFKISKRGFPILITQMYFPKESLNAGDLLLQKKSPSERSAMIAREKGEYNSLKVFEYNIVLSMQ